MGASEVVGRLPKCRSRDRAIERTVAGSGRRFRSPRRAPTPSIGRVPRADTSTSPSAAHDEHDACGVGDKVAMAHGRPLSKNKNGGRPRRFSRKRVYETITWGETIERRIAKRPDRRGRCG